MPSSAALRIQIETALAPRFASALTPAVRTIRDVAPTGIAELDKLLDGGLPVGAISEIHGQESSGRTSIAMAFLSQRTVDGRVCCWVDAADSFDPESAAANGVNLKQLLWVQCGSGSKDCNSDIARRHSSGNDAAWARLDRALRATDLLLQAGGFASIVLDLGDEDEAYGCRIPLATWFRFRQAADRTRCSLIVLGRAAFTQANAAVALECEPLRPDMAGGMVLRGFHSMVRRGRERFTPIHNRERKPPASTWSTPSAWSAK